MMGWLCDSVFQIIVLALLYIYAVKTRSVISGKKENYWPYLDQAQTALAHELVSDLWWRNVGA